MNGLFLFTFFMVSSRDKDKKNAMDPLQDMKKYLEIKKSHKRDKDTRNRERKHKGTGKDSESKLKKSIEELRKERLRREKEEHERERQLIAGARGDKKTAAETADYDAPQR